MNEWMNDVWISELANMAHKELMLECIHMH